MFKQIEHQDGVFEEGDTTAVLTGQLFDGTQIEGTDSICIVPWLIMYRFLLYIILIIPIMWESLTKTTKPYAGTKLVPKN